MDFIEIGNVGALITERNVYHTLVNADTQGLESGEFLSSAWSSCRHKGRKHFAGESLFYPQTAGGIPKGLPLSREVSVTSWNT